MVKNGHGFISLENLTLKAPAKTTFENDVCLNYFPNISIGANSVDPYQTAPRGAV